MSRRSIPTPRRAAPNASSWRQRPSRCRRRLGFTFTEVLFAVMILGIGFILIVGVLPVAIRGTQATMDDMSAKTVFETGFREITLNASQVDMPVTDAGPGPMVWWTTCPTFDSTAGNRICTIDRRFSWLPLYYRQTGVNSASVLVMAVRTRGKDVYRPGVWQNPDNGFHVVNIAITPQAAPNVNLITFSKNDYPTHDPGDPTFPNRWLDVVTEGAYVILGTSTTPVVYRLGNPSINPDLADPNRTFDTWELPPGLGPDNATAAAASNVQAYVLGRGLRNPLLPYQPDPAQPPSNPYNPYEGQAQELYMFGPRVIDLP